MAQAELTEEQFRRWVSAECQVHEPMRRLLIGAHASGRREVDRRCGVYVLMRGDAVVYVGQSECVAVRIGQHVAAGKEFDRYFVVECDRVDLVRLERRVITILRPPLNLTGGERYKGELLPIKRVWFAEPKKRRIRKKAA